MDLSEVLSQLDGVLERRVRGQRRKVFEVAHRLDPRLTWDDVVNPDHPALRGSEAFQYEDGILAGLLSAQILVRSRLRELGAAGARAGDAHLHDDGTVAYRYCPRCGGDLGLRHHLPHDPPRLTCGRCGFVFYLDPKVAAGVILEDGGRIVLARRGIEPCAGAWGFPSGYVDRGERVEDAALREVREEVGVEAGIDRLVGVYSYPGRPVVVIVFAGRIRSGRLLPGHETREVATFPPAEIPWDELAFPSTREALRDYLAKRPGGGPG
jgi:ADP-ribose pyrophosphatase YjhB (NUDIX family)